MKAPRTIEECLAHVPERLTEEMQKYATEVVFAEKRYIFTARDGKALEGYCTYCHRWFDAKGMRHNAKVQCPRCETTATVKSSGMRRARMVDDAYFLSYMKSALDPNVLVAVGTYAVRDFRGDYVGVKTQYIDAAVYVFVPGQKGTLITRDAWYAWYDYELRSGQYTMKRTMGKRYGAWSNKSIERFCDKDSVAHSVAGTPFQYSMREALKPAHEGWQQGWQVHWRVEPEPFVQFFDLYCRCPYLDSLIKLGFKGLVTDKLQGISQGHTINWRGEGVSKILRLNRTEVAELRSLKLQEGIAAILAIYHLGKKDTSRFTFSEAAEFVGRFTLQELKDAQSQVASLPVRGNLRQLLKYLFRQGRLTQRYASHDKGRWPRRQALTEWRDYLDQCKDLDIPFTRQTVFPKNLEVAHADATAMVQAQKDELLDARIRQRYGDLHKYHYENEAFLIRPPKNHEEFIEEGNVLTHCVARNYADKHSRGKTIILFIRSKEAPDTPFYTVEILNGRENQCYGKKHLVPTPEVRAFMDSFVTRVLKKPRLKEAI